MAVMASSRVPMQNLPLNREPRGNIAHIPLPPDPGRA